MKIAALPLVVLLAAALPGCNAAKATTPDSTNPAHCIAAFNYAAFWLKKGDDLHAVLSQEARAAYEMAKLAREGETDTGKAEATALTRQYANDRDAMMTLFEACGKAQDADPQFRARQEAFMKVARRANKDCRRDPECALPPS